MAESLQRLSAIDAFFVAYHDVSDALMHLGVEFEFHGTLRALDCHRALEHVAREWPEILSRLIHRRLWVHWHHRAFEAHQACQVVDESQWSRHRDLSIDPTSEPPLRCTWYAEDDATHHLSVYVHHALMDGEVFFAMMHLFVEALRASADDRAMPSRSIVAPTLVPEYKPGPLDRARAMGAQLKYKRWLDKQHHQPEFTPCALRAKTPGSLKLLRTPVDAGVRVQLQAYAHDQQMPMTWLVMAAWFKALLKWNQAQGVSDTILSMEVPVSLRSTRVGLSIGNYVSQVVLLTDASQPLLTIATDLKNQFSTLVRSGAHRAVAALAAPGEKLPWNVFERLATGPEADGFATGTFVWLTRPEDWLRASETLKMVDYRVMTPACMDIGASLCVLDWPEHLDICLTYRATAFSIEDVMTQLRWCLEMLSVLET